MSAAVRLQEDFSAAALRALPKRAKDANQSRRLLSLAAVRDRMDRGAAAKIGGMGRQTLRDCVHRFNAAGPDGLLDHWTSGPPPRLKREQLAELAAVVEAGPDRKRDGVVRWRRVDLERVIAERFGVDDRLRYVGTRRSWIRLPGARRFTAARPHTPEIVRKLASQSGHNCEHLRH
jgi:transposase